MNVPSLAELAPTVARHRALGDETRLRILHLLLGSEVCVCDLEAAMPVKQPTISHHLKLLRDAGMVENERQGNWSYYFVNRDAVESLRSQAEKFLDSLQRPAE